MQVIETNGDTQVTEGDQSTFQVVLGTQPQQNASVTLTPGADISLVNPVNPGSGTTNVTNYSMTTSGSPANLQLTLLGRPDRRGMDGHV